MTANGIMSRGEFVYMLVQQYFKAEYDSVDLKAECYDDVTNGGDIASKQKFIEKGEAKKYWQSYELTYALQNPDQGCPERLYKALLVAFDKQIIQDEDSRWDEALSRSDFIELTTNAYAALPTITDSERGTMEELSVEIKDSSQTESNTSVDSTGVDIKLTAEDGEYKEPTAEELEAQSVPETPIVEEYSQYSAHTQTVIDNAKRMYEKGIFTKEEYDEIVKDAIIIEEESQSTPSDPGSSGIPAFTPEQQAAHDAMSNNDLPPSDPNPDLVVGQGDYTGLEHIRIN